LRREVLCTLEQILESLYLLQEERTVDSCGCPMNFDGDITEAGEVLDDIPLRYDESEAVWGRYQIPFPLEEMLGLQLIGDKTSILVDNSSVVVVNRYFVNGQIDELYRYDASCD
jgi:hypothetical protein